MIAVVYQPILIVVPEKATLYTRTAGEFWARALARSWVRSSSTSAILNSKLRGLDVQVSTLPGYLLVQSLLVRTERFDHSALSSEFLLLTLQGRAGLDHLPQLTRMKSYDGIRGNVYVAARCPDRNSFPSMNVAAEDRSVLSCGKIVCLNAAGPCSP